MLRTSIKISGGIIVILSGLLIILSSFSKFTPRQAAVSNASLFNSHKITLNEKKNAEQVVRSYFKYLYQGKADAIASLYAKDAVLMPADMPTTIGSAKLLSAYKQTFGAIKFVSATTNYDEISIYGSMAIIRTTSQVNLFMINEKKDVKSKMREFFILNKENEQWKIPRYMFNREL